MPIVRRHNRFNHGCPGFGENDPHGVKTNFEAQREMKDFPLCIEQIANSARSKTIKLMQLWLPQGMKELKLESAKRRTKSGHTSSSETRERLLKAGSTFWERWWICGCTESDMKIHRFSTKGSWHSVSCCMLYRASRGSVKVTATRGSHDETIYLGTAHTSWRKWSRASSSRGSAGKFWGLKDSSALGNPEAASVHEWEPNKAPRTSKRYIHQNQIQSLLQWLRWHSLPFY